MVEVIIGIAIGSVDNDEYIRKIGTYEFSGILPINLDEMCPVRNEVQLRYVADNGGSFIIKNIWAK